MEIQRHSCLVTCDDIKAKRGCPFLSSVVLSWSYHQLFVGSSSHLWHCAQLSIVKHHQWFSSSHFCSSQEQRPAGSSFPCKSLKYKETGGIKHDSLKWCKHRGSSSSSPLHCLCDAVHSPGWELVSGIWSPPIPATCVFCQSVFCTEGWFTDTLERSTSFYLHYEER